MWNGSLRAQQEHLEALAKIGITPRRKHQSRKKKRKQKRRRKRKGPNPPATTYPYSDYLLSPWWGWIRRKKLSSTGGKCERCKGRATQVHHKHYRTLGKEALSDLESICGPCHGREHESLIAADRHLRAINPW